MRRLISVFLLAIGLIGCQSMSASKYPVAPPFQGWSSMGRNYSMLDVTRSENLVAVFVDIDDPNGVQVLRELRKVQDANPTGLQFLGVVDYPPLKIENLEANNPDIIPVISDPDRRIMQKYKVGFSPTIVLIEKGAQWRKTWNGLHEGFLAELQTELSDCDPSVSLSKSTEVKPVPDGKPLL